MRFRGIKFIIGVLGLGILLVGQAAAQNGPGKGRGPFAGPANDRFLDVIVVLNSEFAPGGHAANQAAAGNIARGLGIAPDFNFGTALFGFAGPVSEGRLAALENDPRVAYVNFNRPLSLPRPQPAAPKWCTPESTHPACAGDGETVESTQVVPWGVDRIGAPLAPANLGYIHVYVLDTGIDSNHKDLQTKIGNGFAAEVCKGNGGTCRELWDDDNGHGTHVAGTIGALDNDRDVVGVAPGVTLHAVKVLAKNGSGSWAGVIAGIDWTASQAKDVIQAPVVANMSLSGSGSKTGICTNERFTGSSSLHEAICKASIAGVVFSVAAGNAGGDAANRVPAAYDDAVITVSATMNSGNWPSWSNWGDDAPLWDTSCSAGCFAPVTIAAPGVGVLSTRAGGGTTTMSGTSMAAPHVAGVIALFLVEKIAIDGYPASSAFVDARNALIVGAESTGGFNNTSGHPHFEDFLDALFSNGS